MELYKDWSKLMNVKNKWRDSITHSQTNQTLLFTQVVERDLIRFYMMYFLREIHKLN